MHGSSFIKIVPVSNTEIIRKGTHLNFAMGATLHKYATVGKPTKNLNGQECSIPRR